jgi:hypothetical protein
MTKPLISADLLANRVVRELDDALDLASKKALLTMDRVEVQKFLRGQRN